MIHYNGADLFTVVLMMIYCHMWKLFMLASSQISQILHLDEKKDLFTQLTCCNNEIKQVMQFGIIFLLL